LTALSDAREHLRKAKEFLEAAELNLDLDLFNAATSNAVVSGINAKDAICLALVGKTSKSEAHDQAVPELEAAGAGSQQHAKTTERLATTLGRLLRLKNKSQYQELSVARTDAVSAVKWAQILVDAASDIVTA
jgi:uncharacterized protein (UPF0332 family)